MAEIPTVETRFFQTGSVSKPVRLHSGASLPGMTLAYETYGKLNSDASNAVLVFHAMTGSQHASGWNPSVPGTGGLWTEECLLGWWNDFIGPGRAFDTRRLFVICANYLGGCYGSTGPLSQNPVTGQPFGAGFPRVSIPDMVDSQLWLLDHLGIQKLRAATGASIGGMMTLDLAARYPERLASAIPIATGAEVKVLQRILNFEQIVAIENDPEFHGGDYAAFGTTPARGLMLARMIAHKTFISLEALDRRARDEILRDSAGFATYQLQSPQESYMLHQGEKFVSRFDANSYIRILDAWQSFDLRQATGRPDLQSVFSACSEIPFLLFSIDSDVCYYPEEQEELLETLRLVGARAELVRVHSHKGHDSFLLEPELFTPSIHSFLS